MSIAEIEIGLKKLGELISPHFADHTELQGSL